MSESGAAFSYVALDEAGRRVRGVIQAPNEQAAFAQLKAGGLMPVRVRTGGGGRTTSEARSEKAAGASLSGRELATFVTDLSALLRAGADIRAALSLLGGKTSSPSVQAAARLLMQEVSGGDSLDQALARRLTRNQAFVAALAAAGEASGDMAGGLQRAGDMLTARIAMRDQLVGVLTYPMFVLVAAFGALIVILTMVVPSLAPLAEGGGASPPLPMKVLLATSSFVVGALPLLVAGGVAAVAAVTTLGATGHLARWLDRLFLEGPTRRIAEGLVFGGFAVALGGILASGASVTEALRLALRSVSSPAGRTRLEPVIQTVRQGEALSAALAGVRGFPATIVRLSMVGEESGTLGEMLERAGRLEEQQAMRKVERYSRVLGPALIVLLGALIGLLMAALLSGITGLGDSALM